MLVKLPVPRAAPAVPGPLCAVSCCWTHPCPAPACPGSAGGAALGGVMATLLLEGLM